MKQRPHPATVPATEKQVQFLHTLATRKGKIAGLEMDMTKHKLTLRRASILIDRLKALPDVIISAPQPKLESDGTEIDLSKLHGGHYAVETTEGLKFIWVKKVPDEVKPGVPHPYVDWIFVDIQSSDSYYKLGRQRPGQFYQGKSPWVLQAILENERLAYSLYGLEIGEGSTTNPTLTDLEAVK